MNELTNLYTPYWVSSAEQKEVFLFIICGNMPANKIFERSKIILNEIEILSKQKLPNKGLLVKVQTEAHKAWNIFQLMLDHLKDLDIAIKPFRKTSKKLLICDMDMTVLDIESLDEAAQLIGKGQIVKSITQQAMLGKLDFVNALQQRVSLLSGYPENIFYQVVKKSQFNGGAEILLENAKNIGSYTILVSGGFSQVAETVGQTLGFDEIYCNRLDIKNGIITGKIIPPIVDANYKSQILIRKSKELKIPLEDCYALGDGANDIPMIQSAGIGISYFGKPPTRLATPYQINSTNLASVANFMV